MFLKQYPLVRFGRFGRDMSRLFDDVFPGLDVSAPRRSGAFPAMNVWEDGDCVYAEAEVPGLSESDVEVHVVGNELSIQGQRAGTNGDDLTYYCRERSVGKFARMLTLPFDIDADKVEATLKDGLLTVKLPKADSIKRRKITVSNA